jgi:hypothetical protein
MEKNLFACLTCVWREEEEEERIIDEGKDYLELHQSYHKRFGELLLFAGEDED